MIEDVLQTIIEKQHATYSPAQIGQLRRSLLRMHEAFGGRLSVATGCSGTDLLILVAKKLVRWWHIKFGIDFELVHLWSCDKGPLQQRFISAHFAPQALFEDMEAIASGGTALDIITNSQVQVSSAHLFATGIECDTLSGLNTQSRVAEGVVQAGQGKTGISATATLGYCRNRRPDMVLMECVKNLGSEPKSSSTHAGPKLSDLNFIIQELNKMGYLCLPILLDSLDYGACTSRPRQYVFAFLVQGPDKQLSQLQTETDHSKEFEFPAWWHDCRDLMEVLKVDPLPREDFLLPPGHHLCKQWKKHPQIGSLDRPNTAATSECIWEADHCSAFQQASVPWPPVFSAAFSLKTSHLCRRKAELVYYFEQTVPKTSLKDCSVDVNYSINWARPWFSSFGCIVGTTHTWCFGRSLGDLQVDDDDLGVDLVGEEMLSLQCFPLTDLNFELTSQRNPQELIELAGNAFNGAVVAASLLAMITAAPWDEITAPAASSDGGEEDEEDGSESEDFILSSQESQQT